MKSRDVMLMWDRKSAATQVQRKIYLQGSTLAGSAGKEQPQNLASHQWECPKPWCVNLQYLEFCRAKAPVQGAAWLPGAEHLLDSFS